MPPSPTPATTVLRWRDVATWRPQLFAALRPVLRGYLGRFALTSPAREGFAEALRTEAAREAIMTVLPRLYSRVRVYHGTRTSDPAVFYREGLRPPTAEEMEARLHATFLGGRYPTLTAADIEAAVAEIDAPGRLGRTYVSIDAREHHENSGHYLIYGSEFVSCVAVELREKARADCQGHLTRVGLPTLLTFDVPFAIFDAYWLDALAGTFLEELIAQQEEPGEATITPNCYTLRDPISPAYLVAHHHPERVLDPLRGMIPYRWRHELAAGQIDPATLPPGIAA